MCCAESQITGSPPLLSDLDILCAKWNVRDRKCATKYNKMKTNLDENPPGSFKKFSAAHLSQRRYICKTFHTEMPLASSVTKYVKTVTIAAENVEFIDFTETKLENNRDRFYRNCMLFERMVRIIEKLATWFIKTPPHFEVSHFLLF